MDTLEIIEIMRDALWVLLKIAIPVMMVALVVGLLISLFQALTQIQEMTLSFVPKMVAIFVALMFLFPYIFNTLGEFNERMVDRIVMIEGGEGG